ncbi:type II secretion system F family protein [Arsenicicoccus cauae]|uniref:type II secretion system F family protein n=1 Tax=Arsenicicoccus cauae TaxID=2663847 RepID=UPI00370DCC98
MSPSELALAVGALVVVAVLLSPPPTGDGSDRVPVAQARPARLGRDRPLLVGQVAESADLLAVALSGGCGLLDALDVVAAVVGGRAGHELRVVAAAVRWGVSPSEAWRLVSAGWHEVAAAFVVAERAGVPPSGLLREAATAMRHAEAQAAGERAGVLSARLALPLGLTFLPGFVLTTIVPVVLGMASSLAR